MLWCILSRCCWAKTCDWTWPKYTYFMLHS